MTEPVPDRPARPSLDDLLAQGILTVRARDAAAYITGTPLSADNATFQIRNGTFPFPVRKYGRAYRVRVVDIKRVLLDDEPDLII